MDGPAARAAPPGAGVLCTHDQSAASRRTRKRDLLSQPFLW